MPSSLFRPAIALFCKYPEPGRVKTRLAASIGNERAVAVYRELVRSTLDCVAGLARPIDFFVYVDPAEAASAFHSWLGVGFRYVPQSVGDLGDRMLTAFREMTDPGPRPAVLIGADCPELRPDHLAQAFDALAEHDLVLGPTEDGGYYLIGAHRPYPDLFRNVPWSTQSVRDVTIRRAEQQRLRVVELPPLPDVDTLADLESYCRTAPASSLAQAAGFRPPSG
jgi:rSAM/selenodomain-associated transferase 1